MHSALDMRSQPHTQGRTRAGWARDSSGKSNWIGRTHTYGEPGKQLELRLRFLGQPEPRSELVVTGRRTGIGNERLEGRLAEWRPQWLVRLVVGQHGLVGRSGRLAERLA